MVYEHSLWGDGRHMTVIASHGAQEVGRADLDLTDRGIHVAGILVEPLYRRQGIGTAMLAYAEEVSGREVSWADTIFTEAGTAFMRAYGDYNATMSDFLGWRKRPLYFGRYVEVQMPWGRAMISPETDLQWVNLVLPGGLDGPVAYAPRHDALETRASTAALITGPLRPLGDSITDAINPDTPTELVQVLIKLQYAVFALRWNGPGELLGRQPGEFFPVTLHSWELGGHNGYLSLVSSGGRVCILKGARPDGRVTVYVGGGYGRGGALLPHWRDVDFDPREAQALLVIADELMEQGLLNGSPSGAELDAAIQKASLMSV